MRLLISLGFTEPCGEGRRTSISFLAIRVPAGRALAARTQRRCTTMVSSSFAATLLMVEPSDNSSSRVRSTMSRQSIGDMEKAWSGPSLFGSSVKCFSMRRAPRATAPRTVACPGVWSDKPRTASGKRSRKLSSTRRSIWRKLSRLPV